jgi:hypothetical protein
MPIKWNGFPSISTGLGIIKFNPHTPIRTLTEKIAERLGNIILSATCFIG